jgi:hypothetical protein
MKFSPSHTLGKCCIPSLSRVLWVSCLFFTNIQTNRSSPEYSYLLVLGCSVLPYNHRTLRCWCLKEPQRI